MQILETRDFLKSSKKTYYISRIMIPISDLYSQIRSSQLVVLGLKDRLSQILKSHFHRFDFSPVCAGQVVDVVGVLVEERPLLGRGGELEHLLHHVHRELVAHVHAHYRPGTHKRGWLGYIDHRNCFNVLGTMSIIFNWCPS